MAQPPSPRRLNADQATPAPERDRVRWRKSSFSSANGECVEIATTGSHVLVRDSKNPQGAHLTLTTGEWAAFLAGIQQDEFGPV